MNKIHVVILIMVMSINHVSAQRFQGGLLGGFTASQVDGDSYAGFDKLGLQGGVFVNINFRNNFGAQMEIRYAGKGARKPTSSEDTEVYKLALHYIDLPLMATYTFRKKVVFDLGIVPGYLFAKNGEENGGPVDESWFVGFKKTDIAWMVGVNYKITGNIFVNLRYSYSLTAINDNVHAISSYGPIGNLFGYNSGDYNNYLTLGVYYQIY